MQNCPTYFPISRCNLKNCPNTLFGFNSWHCNFLLKITSIVSNKNETITLYDGNLYKGEIRPSINKYHVPYANKDMICDLICTLFKNFKKEPMKLNESLLVKFMCRSYLIFKQGKPILTLYTY